MEFNVDKCSSVTFGRGQNNTYTLAGRLLESVSCQKDVGVHVPANLKFEGQCGAAVTKANSVLGQIRRAFWTRDQNKLVNAYKTYVLPHLDYCCQVWSPGTQKWVKKIEQVQKRALRLIPSLKGKSYEEKLKRLNMLTLENRRKIFDLINKFKEERMKKEVVLLEKATKMTRSMADKHIEKSRFRLVIRKNTYIEIRNSKTINTFKKNIKDYLMTMQ